MLDYSIHLEHTPPPTFQLLELSGRKAASLNVYYKKSMVLVLILSQEALKQLVSSVVTVDNM